MFVWALPYVAPRQHTSKRAPRRRINPSLPCALDHDRISGGLIAVSYTHLAAKAHFHNGLAFYRSEQYGPAIVEFRASWELSGERDLLSNLSWACERAGRILEAKEYAAKYRDLSRGTDDAERSERRMKFLTERYPDGKPGDAKPAQAPPSDAKPAPTPSVSPLTAQVVQSGDVTPSNGPTPCLLYTSRCV